MDLGEIILYIGFIGLFIFSVWGLLNFDTFFDLTIKFFDSQNPYNIWYPKGSYARFVLRTSLIIGFLLGITIVIKFISVLL